MGPLQMISKFLVPPDQSLSGPPSDGITGLVSNDGGQGGRNQQPSDIQHTRRSQNPGSHQQRVSRQEESKKQAGLDINDCGDADYPTPLNNCANIKEAAKDLCPTFQIHDLILSNSGG